jgi:hypothetical protein
MIAPQKGASLGWASRVEGQSVQLWSNRSGAFAALMLAVSLCGCANPEVFDTTEHWFSKPFDWTGQKGGYTFSELKDTNDSRTPVTANELVSPNGACPPAPAPAAPPPAPTAAQPGMSPPDAAAPTLLGGSVALGMTECQVVYRAGAPSSVQIGSNPNGDRTAVISYESGPRPGIYRFERGRLMGMDRVDVPVPTAKVAKRKKKTTPKAEQERVSTE